MNLPAGLVAEDGMELEIHSNGQVWLAAWHPPSLPAPSGTPHGAAALCVTADGEIVYVSQDGVSWEMPGGRPEGNETWRETMEREVMEEGCARVEEATLLGFSRGLCVQGHEQGLVLVRSLWHARVTLLPWNPEHETRHRRLLRPDLVLAEIVPADPFAPMMRRWLREAGLTG